MKIIFASANKNKINEIRAMLPGNFELLGLADIGITEEIPEPGTTIRENSFLKAEYVVNFLKQKNFGPVAVFADDSGLEVEALNNAPGVFSARYAGEPKNDFNNNEKLLRELQQVTKRKARFVTVICLITEKEVLYFEGEVKGTIAFEPKGDTGFGYDPLFIPQGYRSTFAELGAEVKNAISHRAKAVKQLVNFISNRQS
ncbi:MAG TPA: RdgB/HAM1 family non-canonical purine NTP pyrophosphatase [Bacteroidia bacterium]|nr:RdgB/HAM1 family non-canonical purine NTP pyrophosphatase [Bacteroidia bacterium]